MDQTTSMPNANSKKIKISSKVEETSWRKLQALAAESNQSISGLLTEAVDEYVWRRRVRPEVMEQLKRSTDAHPLLGKLLAE